MRTFLLNEINKYDSYGIKGKSEVVIGQKEKILVNLNSLITYIADRFYQNFLALKLYFQELLRWEDN